MGIFKNLNLSEKLKIFKKSDKDVYCANCGTRTGLITRQWLLDDKCLCVNCQNKLPAYFQRHYVSKVKEPIIEVKSLLIVKYLMFCFASLFVL